MIYGYDILCTVQDHLIHLRLKNSRTRWKNNRDHCRKEERVISKKNLHGII